MSLVALLAVVFVTGCGAIDPTPASTAASDYYEALRAHDYAKAASYFGPQYFDVINQDRWPQDLASFVNKMGDVQSYTQEGWHVNANGGPGGTTTTYVLQYQVTYANYPSRETLTLVRGPSDSAPLIESYVIESEGAFV